MGKDFEMNCKLDITIMSKKIYIRTFADFSTQVKQKDFF